MNEYCSKQGVNQMSNVFKSRKFYAALAALVVSVLGERAGMDANQLTLAVSGIVAYILGVALEDGLKARI